MSTSIKRKQPDSTSQSSSTNKKKKLNKKKNNNNNNGDTNLLKINTNGNTTILAKKKVLSLTFGKYITIQNNKLKNLKYINIIGNPNIKEYLNLLKFYNENNSLYNKNKILPECNLKIIRMLFFMVLVEMEKKL